MDPAALDVPTLERLAFAAWRAEEVAHLCGWRLRFNRGVTRRASSVWTAEGAGSGDLEARIERAEAFYRDRGAAPLFQITPATRPAGLDEALARRGYRVEAPVRVQTAAARDVLSEIPPLPHDVSLSVSDRLDEDWFGLSGRRGRFRGAEVAVYRGILHRARERPAFALARRAGEPVAVGLGVAGAGAAGVFAMWTVAAQRGRGLGLQVLGALARSAQGAGAPLLYLQVEDGNAAALALYARAGFAARYRYHYRRGEAPSRPTS